MKKSILALLFLFSTGIAFSQTTVTLQDQCNCEVLKGTDVSSSGATSPTGADLGDIYVNTTTGTIYFWDGDTWELTASDNQQLTGFTFNDATNTLSLTLENGGSVNVDLSSLSDTLMDSNTTVTSFGIDGTNTNLVITDSDLNTFSVALADLAALIDTDTTLSDAQVATAVNNEFPNLDTDSTDDFSGDFNDLTNVPANLDTDSTDDFSGDFGDLTNVPANLDLDATDDFDGQWSSLSGVPAGFADNIDNDTQLTDAQVATAVNNEFPNLDTDSTDDFSGDFGDLTNVPANLDLDATDDFDGQWSSLTGIPADFADNVDNVDDADNDPANELQAITSTDGTVTVTPNGNDFDLSGFSGDFGDLSNVPANLDTDSTDDFSGDFGDLTNVPANLDLDATDDFDGQWSSLTGVPADFADNVDNVDDADNDPANELQAITSTDGTVTVTPNGNDFDLSGFSGDFGDLSNVPANLDTDSTDDFSGDFNDLTNVPANLDTDSTDDFSGDFGDLTNVPANLDLDSTDDFDGQWGSLTGVPADFADNVDNVDDADNDPANELQAITSTDGTVTVTPNGNDFDLSGFSGDFGDLTNVPANLDLDATDDFDGQWSSLTGIPAGFADNIDNDTQLTDAQVATAVNNEFPNLDTDSTDDFDGQWSSLTGIPADFADNVDNVDDADNDPANELQAITSTDGTVTVTPNGNDFDLSGFSGDFGDLSNVPANLDTDSTDDFSGDFGDLTNVPANLDLDATDDFDGQWSSLTGVPADFADNVDNVDDADSVVGNEYNTGSSITDGVLGITDGGGTEQVDLISNDANNNITFGSDGALYLNVASVSIAETITNLSDNNNGTFTYINENGVSQTINKSAITDNLDGTYTFDNGNGSPITFIGTDNDTQLTDAQVATAVNNEFPNLDTDRTDDFSGDFGDLTNVPANLDTDSTDDFSGDFGDLTNVPANLDLDATDDFDGQWSSLTGIPADFADNVDNVDDADNDPANELQAITSTDGTVTVTPNGNDFDLSGFSGDFGDLSNVPANLDTDSTDDFSGDFGDLTNVPANLDLDSTDDFDGQWSSLTGIPADFADNVDNVDDADSVVGNEYNTGSSITDGVLGITDGGGTEQVDLISNDANNNITFGSDGALYLNVASVSIAETITNLSDNNNGTFTYINENGVSQTINKSAITDNLDGTYTFDNGNGSPITFIGTDNDTQLTDAQVATAVNNEFPNLDTDSTDDFSGDFNDLTNVPANLDTDSTDDFDGQWSSLTGIPADFADNVDNVDDADNDPANELQAITSTDGTVTVTPNGNDFDLSGFSGDFGDLSNVPANLDTDSTDDFSGDFGDLINVPANLDLDSTDDFDGQWSSLTGVPAGFADNIDNDTQLTDAQVATAVNNEFPNLDTDSTDDFSGDFGDLTNIPANLDLDATDDFDGQWSSLTGIPADFADNVDNVDDADNDPANELQTITSTDGTVTVTPNGNDFDLSGFSGDFGDLSNVPANLDTDSTDDFSGDFDDLINVPANLDLDSTDDFDGQWSSLTGVPAGFADNIDNDTQLTDAQVATAVNNEFPNLDTDSTDDFSGDFGDLTNVPANLDLDATDDFDGQWSSLTGIPADFADNVDNVDDADNDPANELQAITSTDGTVTVTPNGNDFDLSGFSGDFGDLTNLPANLDLDATDDFDGQWSSLTGIPADFADNVDNVDDADNDPANELQAITSTDGTVTVTPNGNDFDLSGFSGDFGDLSNVPANLDTDSTDDFSGDFGDLTNVPANLDLDSTDDFDGQWGSLTGVPADFADNVDNVDDADNDPVNELQAITSTDGTVTVTPNGNDFDLSGFSGDFGDLSNVPANLDTDSTDDFSGDFGDLTNVPANLDLDATDDFDGQWSSLTGVPAGFADNIDNDTQLTDAQVATAVNNEFPNLDTDSTDDFDGQWSSLTGVPADFADNVDNVDDADNDPANELQAITSTDGTVTVTPNGNDFDLSGFSGDFGDLSNVPVNLDTDSTDDFDGQWSSLTGIPADFADNVDNVDDADNDPANELQAITSTDGTVTVTPNGNDFDLSGFSGDFGDLSNVPANLDTDSTDDFSGDFGDLTNVPANLDLDATDDFDGQWSSLTGIPADFADNVDNVDDADNDPANELQAITSTDGTVTVTPNGNDFDLSGFSGDFGDLSNVPANLDTDSTDDFSGDFGDLTNVPANLDLDSTDDFDGQWSSLTGIPADFADNVDNVDDADNDPANELQAITSTDGTVTVTPNGNDFDLSGFSGDFGDLTNVPANLDLDSTDDFDGQWSSLTGVPAGFADNIDNDTQLTDAQVATAVNNEFPNLDTDSTDDFSGDFGDLTNVPANLDLDATDDFDGQWGSLTGVPAGFADNIDNDTQLTDAQVATAVNNEFPNLDTDSTDDFSGDFGDLTNVPANLDLDATDDFDGQWSSLTGIPADFADNVDNVDDADNDPANELQAITSTDGTVTVTPNGNDFDLSGFSGDFGDLSNVPANLDTDSTDDFSGDFNDLTNIPANLDLDATDDFDGQWSSLTGVPAGFADNIDNDTQLTDAQVATAVNNEFPNLDTDSTDDFDGQWSSLTGIPADFADNVDNVDDADNDPANELQAITSTDGTVTVTPNGNDFDLSGFSGDFGDLSNVPANLDTDSTDDFDGQWSSLTGIPAGFADNIDNDTQLTDAQVATAVNNEFPNLDTDSTDDFDGQWSSLTGIPADFADNVDNVDDADASVTNEINTRFEVSGANLEIEDSNGTLQVALADIDTDDQTAAQVNSDSPVDVDGDGNTEATVEDVIQDIAPITSKAARIFYPPSIAIDASSNGTGRTVDLYAQYVAQYGTPAVSSAGAPTALPTYSAAELYYYVTYADPTVFDNMSIDANGVLTYDIIGQPADYNALINVVFVVK